MVVKKILLQLHVSASILSSAKGLVLQGEELFFLLLLFLGKKANAPIFNQKGKK